MMSTRLSAAVLAAVLAAPVAAQETPPDTTTLPDTTTYKSAPAPVWIVVEDVEGKAGAHRVRAAVVWDDYRSTLRFATEILAGDLTVRLPKGEGPDADPSESCAFTSALMPHGSDTFQPMDRADAECLAPPVEALPFVVVEHLYAPMACERATRKDGTEDPPTRRYYGCYWAEPPGG